MAFSSSSPRSAANVSDIDAAERAVLAVADQRLDGVAHRGIGGTAERTEQRLGLSLGLGHS